MSNVNVFQLGELSFEQRALPLKEQLAAFSLLTENIVPVIGAIATGGELDPAALKVALSGMQKLPDLVKIFAAVCKTEWAGKSVPLTAFLDEIFARKTTLLLAWVFECVLWQYSDFLGGADSGRDLLAEKVSKFTSALTSTGGSGG